MQSPFENHRVRLEITDLDRDDVGVPADVEPCLAQVIAETFATECAVRDDAKLVSATAQRIEQFACARIGDFATLDTGHVNRLDKSAGLVARQVNFRRRESGLCHCRVVGFATIRTPRRPRCFFERIPRQPGDSRRVLATPSDGLEVRFRALRSETPELRRRRRFGRMPEGIADVEQDGPESHAVIFPTGRTGHRRMFPRRCGSRQRAVHGSKRIPRYNRRMRLRASRAFVVEPVLPEALRGLEPLAANLYWTWNTDAAALFARIDPALWESTRHNPVAMLQRTATTAWETLAADEGFVAHLDRVTAAFEAYLARDPLLVVEGASEPAPIAYFSLEFALTESFPNYSGGLGVLAGDHLKSASDLGIPLVGVGLLYHFGYFHQRLGPDGWQQEDYREVDTTLQPLQPVTTPGGSRVRVDIPLDGRTAVAQVWRLDVGKIPLYLLDTDIEPNIASDRELSSRLYGGDSEMRIEQEIVLGIGGVRALQAIGLCPAACHMNEGHSALLGLERIRILMQDSGASFSEARQPVGAATAFTTHTAVAAGIDLFSPDLVMRYLGEYAASMGLDRHDLLGLGRTNPEDENEPFSMAMLGLRLSGFRNGVSKLHRGVSQRLWEAAWPNVPLEQTPIDSVTNGVHLPTWVSHEVGDLYDRYVGPAWRDDPTRANWARVADIPDEELWSVHEREREKLVARARKQHADALMSRGLSSSTGRAGQALDHRILTVGFARRFAGYKRATLLFRDPERLAAILNHPDRPVQFIFAGKAHPKDEPAKALIREVMTLSERPEFRDRLVLLEDYDLELARVLVQGCDLWLNTPLRPLEASGTSGMKAFANGALNMSVRDGWWWEAYRPGLGWAVGRNRVDDDPEAQDAFDANSIYDLFENDVSLAFYSRDQDGLPRDWLRLMKASIGAFGPVFNTNRMVTEYAEHAYRPAVNSWHSLTGNGLALARDLSAAMANIRAHWADVSVVNVSETLDTRSATVTVNLHTGALAPADLRVDLVYGTVNTGGELRPLGELRLSNTGTAGDGTAIFEGAWPFSGGGRHGYAVRVLPQHAGLHDPFAPGLAHWA